MNPITVYLKGGLGNRLFQFAAAFSLMKERGFDKIEYLFHTLHGHSEINYFDNIFKYYADNYFAPKGSIRQFNEQIEFNYNIFPKDVNFINGFFQQEDYFKTHLKEFLKTLDLNYLDKTIPQRYPEKILKNSFFIHLRGGDFIGNEVFHVKLNIYYENVIDFIYENISKNCNFIIFTNDIAYVDTFTIKKQMEEYKYEYYIIEDKKDANEIDSLILMSKCFLGGICANSTFSWWGTYLNLENPKKYVFFPNKWFTNERNLNVWPIGSYKFSTEENKYEIVLDENEIIPQKNKFNFTFIFNLNTNGIQFETNSRLENYIVFNLLEFDSKNVLRNKKLNHFYIWDSIWKNDNFTNENQFLIIENNNNNKNFEYISQNNCLKLISENKPYVINKKQIQHLLLLKI